MNDRNDDLRPGPSVLVIFGASGDLTWRKLGPSLYDLFRDHWGPAHLAVLGVARNAMSDDDFRRRLRSGIDQFSRHGRPGEDDWRTFAQNLDYQSGDFGDRRIYTAIADRITAWEREWGGAATRVFYMATPPAAVEPVVRGLGAARLAEDRARARIVVEKPFGVDLASAQELNARLSAVFAESQIYRIDHYLGKETVQNILALRFANALFEPIWNRRYIDHVQVTVAETVGVEQRGRYYDQSGALRDMVQNHLLQILCMVAMEPPVRFDADEIRSKKVDVLRAIRPIAESDVARVAVRGQYGPGEMDGQPVRGYREEPDVAGDSKTDTFAAVQFCVDNWRWQDVPFYVRTGKRLPAKVSEVSIEFRPVPHQAFPARAVEHWQPNRLIMRIQPDEGVLLRFQAKRPGPVMHLDPVDMLFSYKRTFRASPPEAYETLLLDVMRGDATLFMRDDQVEAAWAAVMPILTAWQDTPAPEFPNYRAGEWGPAAADALLARSGRAWRLPSVIERGSEPDHTG